MIYSCFSASRCAVRLYFCFVVSKIHYLLIYFSFKMNFLNKTSTVAVISLVTLTLVGFIFLANKKKEKNESAPKKSNGVGA